MKKILTFFLLMTAIMSTAVNINDYNYFTVGLRDTVWVSPCTMSNGRNISVKAHFESRVDTWFLSFNYPTGMLPQSAQARGDMRIQYINNLGEQDTLTATLTTNIPNYMVFSSSISTPGYWYVNGILTSYGTVKWEPNDYDRMFDIFFDFNSSTFTGGTIYIAGYLSSDHDSRGNYVDYQQFGRDITVIKGNMPGDVNGDGVLNTEDVTDMVNHLLDPDSSTWDDYQLAAADLNGDGIIDIKDLTVMINLLLTDDPSAVYDLEQLFGQSTL